MNVRLVFAMCLGSAVLASQINNSVDHIDEKSLAEESSENNVADLSFDPSNFEVVFGLNEPSVSHRSRSKAKIFTKIATKIADKVTRLLIKKGETGRTMRKRTKISVAGVAALSARDIYKLYSYIATTVDSFEPQTPPEEQAKQQLQTFIDAESPRTVVMEFTNHLKNKGYLKK